MARTNVLAWVICWGSLFYGAAAYGGENLVADASFESRLPSWFAVRSGTSYFAAKRSVPDAADGGRVLGIEAWDVKGCRVLSNVIRLPEASEFSATVAVRSIGTAKDAAIELALFDEKGAKKLATFGQLALDGTGTWKTLSNTGVTLKTPVKTCRLALMPSGPSNDLRIEVDCVGLFEGGSLGSAGDNDDLVVLEAETLADGKRWKRVEHYPGWYQGTPSDMKMLAGFEPVRKEDNRPIVRTLKIGQAGPHTLWVRHLAGPIDGRFTVALRQAGTVVAEREIVESDSAGKRGYTWAWTSIGGSLLAGEAELVLTRPDKGTSWVTRKIDLFVLTNRADYVPEVEHFASPAYLRFTNLSSNQEPFCLWVYVRRHQGPHWYANPGILGRSGNSEGYFVPADVSKRLAAGQRSPWVRISDYLLAAGGRNNVQLVATRQSHVGGYVEGRIQGRLEFAVGEDYQVIKTIDVDQDGPRLLLTLPYELQAQPDQIKTALDYIRETEAEIAKLGPVKGTPARELSLTTSLSLKSGFDDSESLRREIGILKSLGFNSTYHLIAPPETAVKFYQDHGLVPRFGLAPYLWASVQHRSQHHPDAEAMGRITAKFAEENRCVLPYVTRCKLMDEPGGMSYEDIARSEPCRQKFAAGLKAQGLTPERLGVKSWAEVAPVLPRDRQTQPELFYHTGMFRLEGFATLAKACVAAKKKYLPDTMRTYVNYSPPTSGGSWTERGTDLFLAHRNGGMETVWTEDWLGYSLGPQHLSDTLALCRAAGRPDRCRVGAYCVGERTPALMRMKYYTLAAGGARDIQCYNYGPWYAGIDSWGRKFNIYGAIRDCNFELGAIDAALAGTKRRRTQVAILYNRTASIWGVENNSVPLNGSFTHWALAHAGYDADYLAEEDVEQGELARYKVLYLDGPQLRRPAAEAIVDWVQRGGVLVGSTGAGSRDPYDRPMDALEKVFAVRSHGLEVKAGAGRPKHEFRALKPLDTLTPAKMSRTPAAELDALCLQERLETLPGASVILTDKAGEPAGVLHAFGQGKAIRVAALPGLSYVHEAIQKPYEPESYLPKDYRAALRDFIAWPTALAEADRVAAAECPIAEIVRYDGPDRAVVFVIDHRAEPVPRFTFRLFDAAGFTRAYAASGNPVELKPTNKGGCEVALPLNVADAVVLVREKR